MCICKYVYLYIHIIIKYTLNTCKHPCENMQALPKTYSRKQHIRTVVQLTCDQNMIYNFNLMGLKRL